MRRPDAPIAITLTLALFLAAGAPACRKAAQSEAADHRDEAAAGPPGTVRLTDEAVKTGGIAVEPAREDEWARRVGAPGEIELNGKRLAHITARASGRLERVAAFRGERVAEGQVLAEIFSREFLALQAEIAQAAARAARLRGGPDEAAAAGLLAAAKAKLIPLGLSPAEADALAGTDSARPFLPVRAPFAGRLVEQAAAAGDAVEPGTSLFRLADLAVLWACVHIPEKDLGLIEPGAEVALRAQAFPELEFRGRLVLFEALMDEKTRTIEGRVEVPNPGERLRPGMYVDAAIAAGGTRRVLTVPEAALQESAQGPVVFVRTAPGLFALRLVETGLRQSGRVEIVRGLAAGEEVVTAGSFLLKSELLKKSLGDEHGHD